MWVIKKNEIQQLRYSKDFPDSYHLKYLVDICVHLAAGNNYNHLTQKTNMLLCWLLICM